MRHTALVASVVEHKPRVLADTRPPRLQLIQLRRQLKIFMHLECEWLLLRVVWLRSDPDGICRCVLEMVTRKMPYHAFGKPLS